MPLSDSFVPRKHEIIKPREYEMTNLHEHETPNAVKEAAVMIDQKKSLEKKEQDIDENIKYLKTYLTELFEEINKATLNKVHDRRLLIRVRQDTSRAITAILINLERLINKETDQTEEDKIKHEKAARRLIEESRELAMKQKMSEKSILPAEEYLTFLKLLFSTLPPVESGHFITILESINHEKQETETHAAFLRLHAPDQEAAYRINRHNQIIAMILILASTLPKESQDKLLGIAALETAERKKIYNEIFTIFKSRASPEELDLHNEGIYRLTNNYQDTTDVLAPEAISDNLAFQYVPRPGHNKDEPK